MRKNRILFFLTLIAVLLLGGMTSCNNEKTYAQKLEEEQKAIKDFIAERDFVVKDVPADSVFLKTENGRPVYYKMAGISTSSASVYVHVIDSGDRTTKVQRESRVSLRVTGGLNIITKVLQYDNSFGSDQPITFQYRSYTNGGCEAWIIPLNFLFENSSVSLIVPSKLGLVNEMQYSIQPIFYEKVIYTSLAVN